MDHSIIQSTLPNIIKFTLNLLKSFATELLANLHLKCSIILQVKVFHMHFVVSDNVWKLSATYEYLCVYVCETITNMNTFQIKSTSYFKYYRFLMNQWQNQF